MDRDRLHLQRGAAVVADTNDDDGFFQDGYAETGGAQTLNAPLTIGGTT